MTQDTDKQDLQQNKARRKVLGAITGVGALTVWNRPLIKSIVLPAHAQTSVLPESFFGASIVSTPVVTRVFSPLDFLISEAVAGEMPPPEFAVLADKVTEQTFEVSMVGLNLSRTLRRGTLNTSGAEGILEVIEDACDGEPAAVPASIISVDATMLTLQIERQVDVQGELLNLEVPVGSGSLPELTCPESDIRLKQNVEKLAITESGLSIYRFRYIKDPTGQDYVGVMAQDLMEAHPDALVMGEDGYYRVRYDRLGLQMSTFEEWRRKGLGAVLLKH